jgi:hypothetical protein
MNHTTTAHHAPFRLWATALLVLVAAAVALLLGLQLASGAGVPAEQAPAEASTVSRPAPDTCGLPPAVARAEGLDPRTCATPREPLRVTGPR